MSLEHLANMTAAQRREEIDQSFRVVFGDQTGLTVLVAILHELCYFLPATGEGPQACNNAAKEILKKCGPDIAGRIFLAYENVMAPEKESMNG